MKCSSENVNSKVAMKRGAGYRWASGEFPNQNDGQMVRCWEEFSEPPHRPPDGLGKKAPHHLVGKPPNPKAVASHQHSRALRACGGLAPPPTKTRHPVREQGVWHSAVWVSVVADGKRRVSSRGEFSPTPRSVHSVLLAGQPWNLAPWRLHTEQTHLHPRCTDHHLAMPTKHMALTQVMIPWVNRSFLSKPT